MTVYQLWDEGQMEFYHHLAKKNSKNLELNSSVFSLKSVTNHFREKLVEFKVYYLGKI